MPAVSITESCEFSVVFRQV